MPERTVDRIREQIAAERLGLRELGRTGRAWDRVIPGPPCSGPISERLARRIYL